MLQGAPPLLVREGPAARLEALAIEERWTLQQDLRDEAGVAHTGCPGGVAVSGGPHG